MLVNGCMGLCPSVTQVPEDRWRPEGLRNINVAILKILIRAAGKAAGNMQSIITLSSTAARRRKSQQRGQARRSRDAEANTRDVIGTESSASAS